MSLSLTPRHSEVLFAFYSLDELKDRELEPFVPSLHACEIAYRKRELPDITRRSYSEEGGFIIFFKLASMFGELADELVEMGLLRRMSDEPWKVRAYKLNASGFEYCHKIQVRRNRMAEREKRIREAENAQIAQTGSVAVLVAS